MNDADFIAAMRAGLPPIKAPGIEVIDCTGILLGNADLELSDIERIEGLLVMPLENSHV
ncbi:hypothetical protein [Xanthomonas campestris]|uniref:hypothetical protein n=1 Tax=Xanthomonas campestris TaxID=339 RepID=UPI0023674C9F|nr:hypothetical protein [Xanthomonas campestris]WDI91962.1 hypothetical protein JH280_11490 [Xanthomonas campestris]